MVLIPALFINKIYNYIYSNEDFQPQMNGTSTISPVSGTVLAQNYASGDLVQHGKTIITIADLTQFQLEVSADELDIAKIDSLRQAVTLKIIKNKINLLQSIFYGS